MTIVTTSKRWTLLIIWDSYLRKNQLYFIVLLEEHVLFIYSIFVRQSSNYVSNKTVLISCTFLAVSLSRFAHIGFVLLFTTAGRISVKFYIGPFYKDLLIRSTNYSNLIKMSFTLHSKVKYFKVIFIVAVSINSL